MKLPKWDLTGYTFEVIGVGTSPHIDRVADGLWNLMLS